MALDSSSGELRWAELYKTDHGSHPYALVLDAEGDVVIAGHALGSPGISPEGRLLKVRVLVCLSECMVLPSVRAQSATPVHACPLHPGKCRGRQDGVGSPLH